MAEPRGVRVILRREPDQFAAEVLEYPLATDFDASDDNFWLWVFGTGGRSLVDFPVSIVARVEYMDCREDA